MGGPASGWSRCFGDEQPFKTECQRDGTCREQRGADGNGAQKATGLHFIALNANIARQFEFIQGTWINNPKFDGLYDDRDPVVSSVPDRTFRVSEMPVRSRVTNLPAFVKVEGGAYFFLPGISALRYLAALD